MDIFFILALIFASVVAVTFIVERGLALRWKKVVPPDLQAIVQTYSSPKDLSRLQDACRQNPSALSRLLMFATEHVDWSRVENSELLETRARQEVGKLERGLVILEIIVGIAPLLGLVGTIYGLITLFGSMGQGGDNSKFAQGISLALYATLIGLLVAIPSLVAWSYYSKKVEMLSLELESLCEEFLRKHYGAEDVYEEPASRKKA
ncbi:MAG: tolQ [Verrucomicrobiales bacterium]|nr:tolQ [Verrucomicrobiales bacterium]